MLERVVRRFKPSRRRVEARRRDRSLNAARIEGVRSNGNGGIDAAVASTRKSQCDRSTPGRVDLYKGDHIDTAAYRWHKAVTTRSVSAHPKRRRAIGEFLGNPDDDQRAVETDRLAILPGTSSGREKHKAGDESQPCEAATLTQHEPNLRCP